VYITSFAPRRTKHKCPLCDDESFSFYITLCKSHKCTPMIVSVEHNAEFTAEEKDMILWMFPDRHVRFKMRTIHDHAHCHLELQKEGWDLK
tara:strand:- start:832 stop:1104 length:273 start_codon:yes stop_codon:yes gene_type:complete